jgi:hypothetical protein
LTGIKPIWVAVGGVILALALSIAALAFSVGGAGRGTLLPGMTPAATDGDIAAAIEADGAAASVVTSTPLAIRAVPIAGSAIFRRASVSVSLENLPSPPDGSVYEAWLTEPGAEPLSLGKVQATDGNAQVAFTGTG